MATDAEVKAMNAAVTECPTCHESHAVECPACGHYIPQESAAQLVLWEALKEFQEEHEEVERIFARARAAESKASMLCSRHQFANVDCDICNPYLRSLRAAEASRLKLSQAAEITLMSMRDGLPRNESNILAEAFDDARRTCALITPFPSEES
jgi:hypothetical protein